jgi:hypothetical protein
VLVDDARLRRAENHIRRNAINQGCCIGLREEKSGKTFSSNFFFLLLGRHGDPWR